MKHSTIIAAVLALALLAAMGCDVTVVDSDPLQNPYRTEHFRIHYDTLDLTLLQIEEIALNKERLLRHVNRYLHTDFDGVIVTFISDTVPATPYARWIGETHETVEYARNDDGHEIAHVVSYQEWGRSRSDFLVEGIAVAAQDYGSGTALEPYAKDVAVPLTEEERNELWQAAAYDRFYYTASEYRRAGAFVHYLCSTCGTASFRSWYLAPGTGTNDTVWYTPSFEQAFGSSLGDVIDDFSQSLRP